MKADWRVECLTITANSTTPMTKVPLKSSKLTKTKGYQCAIRDARHQVMPSYGNILQHTLRLQVVPILYTQTTPIKVLSSLCSSIPEERFTLSFSHMSCIMFYF